MSATVALIGCDEPELAQALREQLLHAGVACEPRDVVALAQLPDRASLEMPQLVVVVQPEPLGDATALIRELALVCPSHIAALGPAHDPRRIMAVMQAGANDYIDSAQWQSMLLDCIVRLRTRTLAQNPNLQGRVIAVVSPSGGAGGSTVSANVATVLARGHGSAMLMDLRLEAGDLAALLDVRPTFSLADLSKNLQRLDESLFRQILTPHSSGVQLLAAPLDFDAIESVTLKGFRRALTLGKRHFPYVVLDLGDLRSQVHQEAAAQADVVAILLRLDYPSLRNVRRCVERLQEIGVDRAKLKFVVNRYGQSRQLTLAQAREALGVPLDSFLPDDPATLNQASNAGVPVVLAKPRARVSKRLTELAAALNGRHEPS
jgi:pilus assembly protein CpaE